MSNKNTVRTIADIQADIDFLLERHDALGANISAARQNPKYQDFARLSAWEGERGHIDGTQLPLLRDELAAAKLAEAVAEYETLDAQRAELQQASRGANEAVRAAQQAVDASAMARGSERVDASFYRRRGAAFISLADAMDAAAPLNEKQNAVELKCMEYRRVLSEAGVFA